MRFIIRWVRYVVFVMLAGFFFGSCTCQRSLPEPPKKEFARRRHAGFHLPTPKHRRQRTKREIARPTRVPPPHQPTLPPASVGDVDLPENFPEDIPVFEDAEPFAVQDLAQDARTVLFRADAGRPEIFEYYRDKLKDSGWKVAQEYNGREQSFLSFKKGDTLTNIVISRDPKTGKQVIAVMYQEQKPLPFPEF